MRIVEEEQLDFDDVLIQPKRSVINSRKDVNIMRKFKCKFEHMSFSAVPVAVSNMGTVGTPKVAKIMAMNGFLTCLEKHISPDVIIKMYESLLVSGLKNMDNKWEYASRVFPSIGVKEDLDNLKKIHDAFGLPGICIDVPNGYIPNMIDRINLICKTFPESFIIAGNVVTPDIAQDYILAGVDCVKIGIGNGSVCKTRLETGVGRPQLSTIIECADACHQVGGLCMSDGGVKNTGDICKALGAGADIVMSGSLFAGSDEADGEVVTFDGKTHFKKYYGMSSHYAQEVHFGGVRSYTASEGREKLIPYTGPLKETLDSISGGIRSCMTYIGAKEIKNIPRQTTFYKVRRQVNNLFENCKDF